MLAFDLGGITGWAVHHADGRFASGVADFTPEKEERVGVRWLRFGHWLTDFKNRMGGIETVYYEDAPFTTGRDASAPRIYGGFEATLTRWCEHHGISYQGVNVSTIKKFITGNGNAPKTEGAKEKRNAKAKKNKRSLYTGMTVAEGLATLGLAPKDHNEADATALLLLGLDRINQKRRAA